MDDFNRVYDYFIESYGEEQVIIFKVEGDAVPALTNEYDIDGYPTFIYVEPYSNC